MGDYTVSAPIFPCERDLIAIVTRASSKGNQLKFISKNREWYYKRNLVYQGRVWRDDLVECTASKLASLGFKLSNCEVLNQYSVSRFNGNGTFSKNFLKPSEQFVTFEYIVSTYQIQVQYYKGVETFKQILGIYERYFKLDATDFLLTQSLLDFIVGNEDRHTHNFGVIKTKDGFRLHPIFDFGIGLFEHDIMYEDLKFRDKLAHMQFKTFDTNQLRLITMLIQKYPQLQKILNNKVVHPSKFNLPSEAAETYLRFALGRLGVKICND